MSLQAPSCVNGDGLRGLCDHVFWSNATPQPDKAFRHGQAVFCKVDEVWRLLAAARRRFCRISIVTGEGDLPVGDSLWRHRPPQVVRWLGTNMFVASPDTEALPLGLGNAGGKKTLSWDAIREAGATPENRTDWLYANFSPHSNPSVRGPLLEWLAEPAQQWITRAGSDGGKESYLRNLLSHRYILCPPGNGEDTHRFWEALYCGATPIIRQSPAMAPFARLGALVVGDFREITPQLLEDHSRSSPPPDRQMLELSYWDSRIEAARQAALAAPRISLADWLAAWWKEFALISNRHR